MQVVGIDAQQNVKKLAGYILYGPATASVALDPIGDVVFGLETLWQHGSANYLSLLLLGAPTYRQQPPSSNVLPPDPAIPGFSFAKTEAATTGD